MSDRMDQKVDTGSIAIQSQRDTNIGLTAEQVIDAISQQLPAFGMIAREIVDARVQVFKDEVHKKLANQEARLEAFGDPGFVSTLHAAQKSYAISGDREVNDMLVDLISRRSLEESRTRKSLSLDQAVEATGNLTKTEFAELSVSYIFGYTSNHGINNIDTFSQYLRNHIDPFVDDISLHDSAYSYLEAQRCATVSMGSSDFRSIMVANYAGLMSKGVEEATFAAIMPSGSLPQSLLTQCLHNPALAQLNATSKDVFMTAGKAAEVPDEATNQLWATFEQSLMTSEEFVAAYEPHVPNLRRFVSAWDETPLSHLQLTTIGIAIGYTNAIRMTPMTADLGIWIK